MTSSTGDGAGMSGVRGDEIMGYQLGIDLGTTYTAAAVCRSDDRRWVEPEVVNLGTRGATVPSVLFVGPDGSVLVGDAAERRAVTDPDRVVREFKRRIGDPTPVVVAGRAWAPEELSARLVRWVVDQVAEREGGSAARIAVTHPASWGQHKKELLAAALAGQGLTVTFLAEPQAAALHYAANERIAVGSTIAVYDLGGGTFDAAVVRKADRSAGAGGFGLLGRPEGLERLGGVDFDEAVFEHVREGLPAAFEDLDEADPAVLSAVARVRRDCTEAKEALSSDTDVSIPVLMPAARGSVRLHRSEFESMIRPRVDETVAALRQAVRSAGLTPEQLSTVLLVGGSSRIPLVAQLVSEQLGRPVAVDTDPKNAIAKGAALAVSPKPTASWPEVAIAPVPAMAAAAHSRAAAPAPAAAPARPPRHASPPPPAPRRGSGPSHEPATSLLSNSAPPPRAPDRPRVTPTPDWEYEREPEPRRRNAGLLVGIGGLLAVLAVVIVAVVLANSSSTPTIQVGTDGSTPSGTTTSADTPAAPPAPAAGGGVTPKPGTSGNGGGAAPKPSSGSGGSGTGSGATRSPDSGSGGTGATTAPAQATTSSAPAAPVTTQPAGTPQAGAPSDSTPGGTGPGGTAPGGNAQGPASGGGTPGGTAQGPTGADGGGTTPTGGTSTGTTIPAGGVVSGGTPVASGGTAVAEPPAPAAAPPTTAI